MTNRPHRIRITPIACVLMPNRLPPPRLPTATATLRADGADSTEAAPMHPPPTKPTDATATGAPSNPALPDEKPPRTTTRLRWLMFGGVAAAMAIAGALTWWLTRPPAVTAITVQFAPLVRTLQFSARVATTSRVEIGSTITGRAVEVLVMEGAEVKKGDALIRFESDELRAALGQAQAGENQANARIDGLRSTSRRIVDAGVVQAESVATKALVELRRTENLTKNGFLSQSRLDDANSAAAVAEALRISAVAQSAANRGTEMAQAHAQLNVAHAASAAAAARLAQSVVLAPADGKVLTRSVEPGQIVQPGRALFNLALVSPLQLIAQVDERYLEQLQIGQLASVIADAFPTERFSARVQLIAPLVDAQRGAIQVRLTVPAPPPAFLREDMTLSVEVETARRPRALVVPVAALQGEESAQTATVMIVKNGHAQASTVRVGIRTLKAAEIIDGLTEGDTVLTGAAVKSGSRVRPQLPLNADANNANASTNASTTKRAARISQP